MSQTCVVGALACQKNSYLRSINTEVISCVKLEEEVVSKPTKSKNKALNAESDYVLRDSWLIEFADSVLFPEGGGQPSDHGTLVLSDGSKTAPISIKFVERKGLRCVCHSPQPLNVGDSVLQMIDFNRRWDHMQQHTGQHLLSAIMDTYDNLETLGWGMGAQGEMNYVELPRKPSQQEVLEIQNRCNEVIKSNHPITVTTDELAEAPKLPGNYDKEKGVVRLITIADIDSNPCCGTHLSQTSHIGLILLHHTSPIRSTNTRLYFTAGDRATTLATNSINTIRTIAQDLSCGTAEVITNVKKNITSAADLRRREKKLMSEIAKYEGDRVKSVLQAGRNAWVYRPDGGMEFINMITFEVKDVIKERGMVTLASGDDNSQGQIVVVGEKVQVESFVNKVKETIDGIKGGGSGGKWQGKVASWRKGELEMLKTVVES